MKSESEPPPSDAPESGPAPALVSEPVDQVSHNDGEVDAPADEGESTSGERDAGSDGEADEPSATDGEADEPSATASDAPETAAAANAGTEEDNEGEAPVAEGSRDWNAERLSAVEADALAESFRPSWETDWGGAGDEAPAAPAVAPAPAVSSAPPPAAAAPARPVATATPVARSGDDTDALAVVLPGESDARRNLMIGAGIFVVAIVVIMFFMLSGGDDDADPSIASAPSESDPALAAGAAERTEELVDEAEAAEEAEASDEAIAAEQAEADEAAAEEPEPVTYQLSVRTVPPGASLTLDGQPVANPLSRAVEADEEEHRLVATAEGYEEASATLRFDGDHERVLTLEAEPPPPPVAMAEPAVMEAPPTMRASRRTTRRASMRTSMRTTASMRRSRMSRGAGFTTSNPY